MHKPHQYVQTLQDETEVESEYTESEGSNDPLEKLINKTKNKVKKLNPLRRARRKYVSTDGMNNPNILGQDNGANAWLDAQLHKDEVDRKFQNETRYAKFNSDHNRCYRINDIPIKGPPSVEEIPSDLSENEVLNIAQELMNKDNLYYCRNTGMMRKLESKEKRCPCSTVTKVHKKENHAPWTTTKHGKEKPDPYTKHKHAVHGYYKSNRGYNQEWYEEQGGIKASGWDTEAEFIQSDDESQKTREHYLKISLCFLTGPARQKSARGGLIAAIGTRNPHNMKTDGTTTMKEHRQTEGSTKQSQLHRGRKRIDFTEVWRNLLIPHQIQITMITNINELSLVSV